MSAASKLLSMIELCTRHTRHRRHRGGPQEPGSQRTPSEGEGDAPQLSPTVRPKGLAPANPCVVSVTHPELHVQAALSGATHSCEPPPQAAAAAHWGRRYRRPQGAAVCGGVRREQRREKGFYFSYSQSMAVRLITENATDEEVASLRKLFATVEDNTRRADIDEYSDLNIGFHQAIIALSTSQWLATMTESLLIHMCAIRALTIGENDRAQRSIIDHMNIMTALEDRDADLTECLSREHTLGLAAPVEKNVTYLDEGQLNFALG